MESSKKDFRSKESKSKSKCLRGWLFANHASIKVAQKLGFVRFDGYDTGKPSKDATGYYHRFVKERPDGLPPGILQGASIEYWWAVKDPELLSIVVENQKTNEGKGPKMEENLRSRLS